MTHEALVAWTIAILAASNIVNVVVLILLRRRMERLERGRGGL